MDTRKMWGRAACSHCFAPKCYAYLRTRLATHLTSSIYSTVKSSKQFSVQLTCPNYVGSYFLCIRNIVMCLLILYGDVESNPGLNTEQLRWELTDGQKSMHERFDTTEGKLNDVETSLALVKEAGEKNGQYRKKNYRKLGKNIGWPRGLW